MLVADDAPGKKEDARDRSEMRMADASREQTHQA